MNKKQKIILVLIALIFIIIIFMMYALYNIKNSKYIEEDIIENENTTFSEIDDVNIETQETQSNIKLRNIESSSTYFTAKSIALRFINSIAREELDVAYDMLNNKYAQSYGITKENIIAKSGIAKLEDMANYKMFINDMVYANHGDTLILLIDAYIVNDLKYNRTNVKYAVSLSSNNSSFNIYMEDYINTNKITVKVGENLKGEFETPTRRKYNNFEYATLTDKDLANYYFYDYKDRLYYSKNDLYNNLDTNYAKKKFGNQEAFNNYLNSISFTVYTMQINEYRIYSAKDYTDYICTDQYNNYYIFREQGGTMNYKVFLDNYTIELDTFKKNYDEANDTTKLAIQVGKIKQMLNTKDYKTLYSKLNTTFRNNNFSSESKLETYLKNNVYDINTIEVNEAQEKDGYYVCSCTLTNQKNKNESKKMNIIIKLIDSNNFEFSFSF